MTSCFDDDGRLTDDAGAQIERLLQADDPQSDGCAAARARERAITAMLMDAARHARGARAIGALDRAGALRLIVPQVDAMRICEQNDYHHLPVLAHTFEALERLDEIIADPSVVSAKYAGKLASTLSASSNVRDQNADSDPSDSLENVALLRLALLFHDAGKPESRRFDVGGRITFYGHDLIGADIARGFAMGAVARAGAISARAAEHLANSLHLLVRNHLLLGFIARHEAPSERSVRRFIRKLGDLAPLEIVMSFADRLATRGPLAEPDNIRMHSTAAETVLTAYFDPPAPPEPPLITGHDVMEATGLPESQSIGRILAEVKRAQQAGEICSREQALKMAIELANER